MKVSSIRKAFNTREAIVKKKHKKLRKKILKQLKQEIKNNIYYEFSTGWISKADFIDKNIFYELEAEIRDFGFTDVLIEKDTLSSCMKIKVNLKSWNDPANMIKMVM